MGCSHIKKKKKISMGLTQDTLTSHEIKKSTYIFFRFNISHLYLNDLSNNRHRLYASWKHSVDHYLKQFNTIFKSLPDIM